jgi:hypothetical protein
MKKIRRTQAVLNLPTLTLEGGLFLPDQLEKAALGSAQWQTEADYGTPKGLKPKDDYSRAFQIACAQWKHFAAQSGSVGRGCRYADANLCARATA